MFTMQSVQAKSQQMMANAKAKTMPSVQPVSKPVKAKPAKSKTVPAPTVQPVPVPEAIVQPLVAAELPKATKADLGASAMLVYTGFMRMGQSKKDAAATEKAILTAQAESDAGAFIKRLFPANVPELKKINAVIGKAQGIYEGETLPWEDGGGRLLPAKNFLTFTTQMNAVKDELAVAVRELQDVYDDLVLAQKVRLGDLFNADDYPTKAEVGERFGVFTKFYPIPTGADFRVDLIEASAAEAIRAEIDKQAQASLEAAVLECYGRLWDVTSKMAYILDPEKPKSSIKATLVENLRAAVAAIPRFNVTNDQRLTELANKIKAELGVLDAQELRDDKTKRAEVLAKAEAMTSTLGAILGL